jgi:hypothetical protein
MLRPVPPVGETPPDIALEAATLALTGRQRREASRFASIELRASDPDYGAWRALAFFASAATAVGCVIALWFL